MFAKFVSPEHNSVAKLINLSRLPRQLSMSSLLLPYFFSFRSLTRHTETNGIYPNMLQMNDRCNAHST